MGLTKEQWVLIGRALNIWFNEIEIDLMEYEIFNKDIPDWKAHLETTRNEIKELSQYLKKHENELLKG